MKNSISPSVWVITGLGLALIAALIWSGLSRHKSTRPENPVPVAAPMTTTMATNKPVAPVAKKAAPSPADLALAVIPISLTNVIIESEKTPDGSMKILPTGVQTYGGIEFWLQGLVNLQGLYTRDEQKKNFRTSVVVPLDETNFADGKTSVTERGKNIASIYLLTAVRYSAKSREKVADVTWQYADGTVARSDLLYDVSLRDWTRKAFEIPAQLPDALAKIAWHEFPPGHKDRSLRLYRLALVNPHPEKTIQALEFTSAMARSSLFIAALTLDPLMPGARPDDLTSQELGDPELNAQIQILVEDTAGHPLPDAQVTSDWRSKTIGSPSQKFTTDNNGLAQVRYSDIDLQSLDVSAEHDGFSGRKMLWDVSGGDKIPPSYTLKLAAEVKIGGLVVDPDDHPVSEASISVYRFWMGDDGDPNRKGEQPSFSNKNVKTDSDGKWEVQGLPESLLDHIGFNVNHPDFVQTNLNLMNNSAVEKQLRDETFKIVLQHGTVVSGLVSDNYDAPISGATVWTGHKYSSERKQTTTGDDGHFTFNNVPDGDVLFAASAKGHAADTKNVNVHAGLDEIVFRLSPGVGIRAHVQDESSQPVANAQVNAEGGDWNSPENALDFSARTDTNGDFSWDGAPNETMSFSISHDGFEAKRDVQLAPNQDNTVTLRRDRTLQGVVLDATTSMPVTNFTVRTGTADDNNPTTVYGVIINHSFSPPDGTFTTTISEDGDNAVLVYADGYADTVQKFPDAQNGVVQVTVKMPPAVGLSGVVLAPDGTPAPNVTVAAVAAKPGSSNVQLSGGRLRSWDSRSKTATTDVDGKFTIPTVPDEGTIAAAGDPGFASAAIADVRNSGTVSLQAWGRIEGSLKIGGQPGVGKDLQFNLGIPGIYADFNGYKATTDDQGNFTIEKVPPGDGYIVRQIQTSPNSWMGSDKTAVTVKPGETTQVTLGDTGATLVGHVRYEVPPTNSSLNVQGMLNTQMTQQPKFNSPQEAQAYYQSPAWQAIAKLMKNYAFALNPDGSFEADDVAPGTYSLNVTVRLSGNNNWTKPPVATGSVQVTVPDSFDPASPIDIGEVVLSPPPPTPATQQ